MKKKRTMIAGAVVVMVLLLGLTGGGLAQNNGPQAPLEPGAAVDDAFTYQGRLTDGGSPANGTYDFEFKLYDSAGGVGQVGSTVTVDDVTVTDGLFTVELDFGYGRFTGAARWLEIGVRAGSSSGAYTTLAPRQALTATPYALSLKPGAQVIGDVGLGSALAAKNTNSVAGFGLYGTTDADTAGAGVAGSATSSSGEVHGVWGESNSPDGYGGYFSNNASGGVDIMADGTGIIKSKADSVLYLSPHDMVVRGSSGVSITPLDNGGAHIDHTSSGWKYISLPVSTFGALFGSPLYIKSVQVCYSVGGSSYIGLTSVIKNNGSTGATNYIYDTTDRTSGTHTCYTITDPSPVVIDNSTWVQFNIGASGTGYTNIYTVKLTLTETP